MTEKINPVQKAYKIFFGIFGTSSTNIFDFLPRDDKT